MTLNLFDPISGRVVKIACDTPSREGNTMHEADPTQARASDPSPLPPEWLETAHNAARNLGMNAALHDLTAEQWQRVLANVETRMRMRGAAIPGDWREQLRRRVQDLSPTKSQQPGYETDPEPEPHPAPESHPA